MKKTFLFFAFLACSIVTSFAQDKVYLHNGSVATGKVVENEPSYIKLQYEGEEVASTLGKAAIEKIEFKSGRIESCSQKVVINDPKKEYGKIQVLREKEDCVGLVRIQAFTEKSGGMWSLGATSGKYMQKTIKKLQIKAAELGGCAILITSEESKGASIFRNPDARVSAIVYKY